MRGTLTRSGAAPPAANAADLWYNDRCIIGYSPAEHFGGTDMATSYKKLWHILLDRNLKKKDLQAMAHLTQYQMGKLGRNESVTTDILGRICTVLDVKVDDIMEFVSDEE